MDQYVFCSLPKGQNKNTFLFAASSFIQTLLLVPGSHRFSHIYLMRVADYITASREFHPALKNLPIYGS